MTDPRDLVVTKLSPWSVADTVSRLSAVVAARGIKVFAVIDHSGEAKAIGLELRETQVVIFGSPNAGTPVMVAAPLGALAKRYGLSDELARRLAGIDAVTDAAIDS